MTTGTSARILAPFIALASAFAAPPVYTIDTAHSSAQFSVKHMMVNDVAGEFTGVSGTVEYDPLNPVAAKVDATIDATTIDTRQAKRDAHLRSADFFEVARFPTIRFVSKQVVSAGPGKLNLLGDLTMHGVTREITLEVEGPSRESKDSSGSILTRAAARTRVSRREFGLTWNKLLETGGVVVGDEVQITLDIRMIRGK
jgi:polyisoprenoid-binding protein YceI